MTQCFSLQNKTIWIAGHRGMVGSAMARRLQKENCTILTNDLDLRIQADVSDWLAQNRPNAIILAAAKVGGIAANNSFPAEFLYDNLMIQSHIIHAAYQTKVEKLLFLGSSCIYPKLSPQPIPEESLLTGALEPTNEAYAIAKIAGTELCRSYRRQYGCHFIAAMPCNLYGTGDRYHAHTSHVIPALMMKLHQAKEQQQDQVEIWGSGTPLREFLYIDDLAEALVFLLENYDEESHINIGSGNEISIAALARMMARIIGFQGTLVYNEEKPDGTPRKLMDNSRIKALGWQSRTPLKKGLEMTYQGYCHSISV